tara:strand:+ start:423 stop:653 length:231 start_codon:yes stop_codon:yes gene_type:complete
MQNSFSSILAAANAPLTSTIEHAIHAAYHNLAAHNNAFPTKQATLQYLNKTHSISLAQFNNAISNNTALSFLPFSL